MDAVAPLLIGVGLWLAYEAYKNPSPTPITSALAGLKGTSTGPITAAAAANPTPQTIGPTLFQAGQ